MTDPYLPLGIVFSLLLLAAVMILAGIIRLCIQVKHYRKVVRRSNDLYMRQRDGAAVDNRRC